MKQDSNYHKILRVSAVVCALTLVFESGLLNSATAQLSQNTHSYLASTIGMSASVQPTELNKMTAALTERDRDLSVREAALNEREIAIKLETSSGSNDDRAVYILASILFILLVLIVLNYTLDYLRARERLEVKAV